MTRGGIRAGAGRKPPFDQETFLSMGARADELLAKRSHGEALVRLSNKVLVRELAQRRAAVEAKWDWPALCNEAIAQRRDQLAKSGWTDADLDELEAGTLVGRPLGMVREIEDEARKVFGTRERGYREPYRRAYRARAVVLGQVVEEYRALVGVHLRAKVTIRLVERALVAWRKLSGR